MPCEIVVLNTTACRVDYQTWDQGKEAVFLRER